MSNNATLNYIINEGKTFSTSYNYHCCVHYVFRAEVLLLFYGQKQIKQVLGYW
jgi:hypothetical protein